MDETCPVPEQLEQIGDYTLLSGDHGSNKPWLRAEGKTFGHRRPASALFIHNDSLDKSDDSKAWREIEALIKYAVGRAGVKGPTT